MQANTLTPELLRLMDAYWRAANYLSVGQIYLYDNPLLKRPLVLADVKRMLLGHWGTTPGQNFIYVHLNRAIKKFDLDKKYNIEILPTQTASSAAGILALQMGAADVGSFGWNEIARMNLLGVAPWLRS